MARPAPTSARAPKPPKLAGSWKTVTQRLASANLLDHPLCDSPRCCEAEESACSGSSRRNAPLSMGDHDGGGGRRGAAGGLLSPSQSMPAEGLATGRQQHQGDEGSVPQSVSGTHR